MKNEYIAYHGVYEDVHNSFTSIPNPSLQDGRFVIATDHLHRQHRHFNTQFIEAKNVSRDVQLVYSAPQAMVVFKFDWRQ